MNRRIIIIFLFNLPLRFSSDCVKWGRQFDVSLTSENVHRGCNLPDGSKICCAAVNNSLIESRGVGADTHNLRGSKGHAFTSFVEHGHRTKHGKEIPHRCEITKVYIPSPYENLNLQYAQYLQNITEYQPRWDNLTDILISDKMIQDSNNWLSR